MGNNGQTEKVESFEPSDLNNLAEFITTNDWCPSMYTQPKRLEANWKESSILAFDVDNDGTSTACTLKEALELFKEYAHVITTSKSHQIAKHGIIADRFRVILFLEEVCIDSARYKSTWYDMQAKYPFIDKKCKDLARFFFKSKEIVSVNEEGITIPISQAKILEKKTSVPRGEGNLFTKGELSKSTLKFLTDGAKNGEWNNNLYKAAKDFQEQGYEEDETIVRLQEITGDLDTNDLTTISSAFLSDPKYSPRNARPKYLVPSAFEISRDPKKGNLGDLINGPDYMDCLEHKWRKRETIGVLASPGSGKTEHALNIIEASIENNKNDDIHVFFSLEMAASSIIHRWKKRVGNNDEMFKRLYVVDNQDPKTGALRHIGLQEIYWHLQDLKEHTGKNIGVVAIDHVSIVNNTIDIKKEPSFGCEGELDGSWGNIKSLSHATLCTKFLDICKVMDCFVVELSQTTKANAGDGDTPINAGGAYGAAQFEWYVHYNITVWQPLLRVYDKTDLRVSAWQYTKIREQGKGDQVKKFKPNMLHFDQETGKMRPLTDDEAAEFHSLIGHADEMRSNATKKKSLEYVNSPVSLKRLKELTKPLLEKFEGGRK